MRRIGTLAVLLAALFLFSGCVRTDADYVDIAPGFSSDKAVEFDFTQLHNDTISGFEQSPLYSFVQTVDITGSNQDKLIYVRITSIPDAGKEEMDYFIAALLRRINDAANIQDMTVRVSDSTDFGSLWDRFGFEITVTAGKEEKDGATEEEGASEAQTEAAVRTYTVKAGEKITLDPDVESYEAKKEKQREIFLRNLE